MMKMMKIKLISLEVTAHRLFRKIKLVTKKKKSSILTSYEKIRHYNSFTVICICIVMFVWQFAEWNVILAEVDWTGHSQPVKTERPKTRMNLILIGVFPFFLKKKKEEKSSFCDLINHQELSRWCRLEF